MIQQKPQKCQTINNSIQLMPDHQIALQPKPVQSRREDIACWRDSHARSLITQLPSQESMVQPKPQLSVLISSLERNTKTQCQLLPTLWSQLSTKFNSKSLILLKTISFHWSEMMEHWKKTLNSQPTTQKSIINWKLCGSTTKTRDKFSSQSPVLSSKRKSPQEELNNDLQLLFISFLLLFFKLICLMNLSRFFFWIRSLSFLKLVISLDKKNSKKNQQNGQNKKEK